MVVAIIAGALLVLVPALLIGTALADRDDTLRLLAPVIGLAMIIVLLQVGTVARLGGTLMGAALLVATVVAAGACAWRRLLGVALLWPVAAIVTTTAIYLIPVIRLGRPAVLGYDVANDAILHATMARWIADGRPTLIPDSPGSSLVQPFYDSAMYGAHGLLAAVGSLTNGVFASYTPVHAAATATVAAVAYLVLAHAGMRPAAASVAAVVASAGYLHVGYLTQGFLTQLVAFPMIAASAVLAPHALRSRSRRPAAVLGLIVGAAAITYSLPVVLYAGCAAIAAVLLVCLVRDKRPSVADLTTRIAIGIGVAVLAVAPSIPALVGFLGTAATGTTRDDLGHLLGPIWRREMFGVWLSADFRLAPSRVTATDAGVAVGLLLAGVGALAACARRVSPAISLFAGAFGGWAIITHFANPYYDAKALQVLSFAVALAVIVGGFELLRHGRGIARAGLAGAGAVALGLWAALAAASVALVLRSPAASSAAVPEMIRVGDRLGRVPTLALVSDQWWWYAFRGAYWPHLAPDRGYGGLADSDAVDARDLDRAAAIVTPRIGGLSTPPVPFSPVATSSGFLAWRRAEVGPLPARIAAEEPGTLGGRVLAPGATIAVPPGASTVRAAVTTSLLLPIARIASGSDTAWTTWDARPEFAVPIGPSSRALAAPFAVGRTGRYRINVLGQTNAFAMTLDGVRIAVEDGGPLVSMRPGVEQTLAAGPHTLELPPPPAGRISYVLAVSIVGVDPDAPAELCSAAGRPLPPDGSTTGSPTLVNCGKEPVTVDWFGT